MTSFQLKSIYEIVNKLVAFILFFVFGNKTSLTSLPCRRVHCVGKSKTSDFIKNYPFELKFGKTVTVFRWLFGQFDLDITCFGKSSFVVYSQVAIF